MPTAAASKVRPRMRHAPRVLLAGGLGFAVSFLVACGGGAGLLTGGESSNLNSQLDAVASAVNSGQCGAAATAVSGFGNAIANLHASLSPTLRRNLVQGASTVSQLAAKDCHTISTTTTTTTPTTSTSSTTSSSPSSSSSSSSTTTTSAPPTSSTSATTTSTPGTTSTSGSGGAGLGGNGGNGNGGNGQ